MVSTGINGKGARKRLGGDERKAQIIDIASALIAERGYWGVSIQDVAVRCDITDTAVLHHFGTKEQLLLAVLQHRDEKDRCALADRLGIGREELYQSIPSIDLNTLCEAMVRRNAEQPEIVRLYALLSAEALQPHHPAHGYFIEREKIALSTFAKARSSLALEPLPRARLVLALMDGLQLRWLRDRQSIDLVAEWQSVAAVLGTGAAPSLVGR